MSDPLSVLRDCIKTGKKVVREEDKGRLVFNNEYTCPLSAKTTYRSIAQDFYTIEAVWFLQQLDASVTHPEYVKLASSKHIPVVSLPDKKDLLNYIRGLSTSTPARLEVSALTRPVERLDAAEEHDEVSDEAERAAKRARLDEDEQGMDGTGVTAMELDENMDAVVRETQKRERRQRTRNSVLRHETKDFSFLLATLKGRRAAKETRAREQRDAEKRAKGSSYSRYKDVNPDVYLKERFGPDTDADIFGIDTTGTNIPKKANESSASSPAPLSSSSSASRSTHASSSSSSSSSRKTSSRTSSSKSPSKPKKKVSSTPIIIVPASLTSMINIYNVSAFLQDLIYVPAEQKRKEEAGKKPQNVTIAHRQRTTTDQRLLPYQVIDSVEHLTPDDWKRVVAVFTDGKTWQFKGWPYSSPTDIFSKACGFHLKFDDQATDSNVTKWNVKVLSIPRGQRHLDQIRVRTFWDTVEKCT